MSPILKVSRKAIYEIPMERVKLIGLVPTKPRRFKVGLWVASWRGVRPAICIDHPTIDGDSFDTWCEEEIPAENIPEIPVSVRALVEFEGDLENAIGNVLAQYFAESEITTVTIQRKGNCAVVKLAIGNLEFEDKMDESWTDEIFNFQD